jgi:hypothetical protein
VRSSSCPKALTPFQAMELKIQRSHSLRSFPAKRMKAWEVDRKMGNVSRTASLTA